MIFPCTWWTVEEDRVALKTKAGTATVLEHVTYLQHTKARVVKYERSYRPEPMPEPGSFLIQTEERIGTAVRVVRACDISPQRRHQPLELLKKRCYLAPNRKGFL